MGDGGNGVLIGADLLAQFLGVEPRRQGRRADEIAEQGRSKGASSPHGASVKVWIAGGRVYKSDRGTELAHVAGEGKDDTGAVRGKVISANALGTIVPLEPLPQYGVHPDH